MSGSGHGSKQERQQEQAIAALLTSPSIATAAKQIGVSERTLDNWIRDPSFSREYRRVRQQIVEQAVGVLMKSMTAAVGTLLGLLKDKDSSVKCRAAVAIIKMGVGALETQDLTERLAEIEAMLQQREETT